MNSLFDLLLEMNLILNVRLVRVRFKIYFLSRLKEIKRDRKLNYYIQKKNISFYIKILHQIHNFYKKIYDKVKLLITLNKISF